MDDLALKHGGSLVRKIRTRSISPALRERIKPVRSPFTARLLAQEWSVETSVRNAKHLKKKEFFEDFD
jgi:hypothetical protein